MLWDRGIVTPKGSDGRLHDLAEATVSVPLDGSEVVASLDPRDFSLDAALARALR